MRQTPQQSRFSVIASALFFPIFVLVIIFAGVNLVKCGREDDSKPPTSIPDLDQGQRPTVGYPRDVTDSRGIKVTLYGQPTQIISLAPSVTEILFALGLGDKIVGDTTACDYPPQAKDLPHVGGVHVEIETVISKHPNLVVVDKSLGVEMSETVRRLEQAALPIIAINPRSVSRVLDGIRIIGQATAHEQQADKLINDMQTRIERVHTITAPLKDKPKIFICFGVQPNIYTTGPGSYIDDLIGIAGGKNIAKNPAPVDVISSEVVVQERPDVIIANRELIKQIKKMPGWSNIPAVKNNRFFVPSDDGIIERAGPRLADGVEELAHYLHPDLIAESGNTK